MNIYNLLKEIISYPFDVPNLHNDLKIKQAVIKCCNQRQVILLAFECLNTPSDHVHVVCFKFFSFMLVKYVLCQACKRGG